MYYDVASDPLIHELSKGPIGPKEVPLKLFKVAGDTTKVVNARGCGGVGPNVGPKRMPTLLLDGPLCHSTRNVDETELGMPKDCSPTECPLP